jgi:arylsulfatase
VAFFNGINVPSSATEVVRRVGHREDLQPHVGRLVVGLRHALLWFKQNASRLGGINQNMVVSWPARIKDKGGLREQFVHVIDVVPTILEAAGIKAPEMVDGIKQAPIEGTSFAYTFDAQNAKAPSRHKTQYFEMFGQWALYDDGWLLSTKVNRAPWEAFGAANSDPLNNQVLNFYNLNKDFNQTEDLAAQNPHKVQALKKVHRGGEEVPGLPDGRVGAARIVARARTSPPGARVRLHPADDRLAAGRLAVAAGRFLHISADLEVPRRAPRA